MVDTLEVDYESASEVDLRTAGLDLYSRHPSTRVLMAAYSINGGPWQHWQAHLAPIPEDFRSALMDSRVQKWAFNAQFERVMTKNVLHIPTPVKNWRCTLVMAALMSFGGDLAEVGERIGLAGDKTKLSTGKRLIKLFSMPQRPTKKQPHVWRNWQTDPEQWAEFCEYNIQDCIAERAIRKRLEPYPIPAFEWELYEHDQIINDRGKPVDVNFVTNAITMSSRRKAELTEDLRAVTGLANPGSPIQFTQWLKARGFPFSDIRKDTVAKVLNENKASGEQAIQDGLEDRNADPEDVGFLAPEAVKALRIREWQARLSVKKYDAILQRVAPDGVIRYMLQMAGAPRTGRWAGRGPQVQNLPGTPWFLEDPDTLGAVSQYIRNNDYDALSLFTHEPMDTLVGALRSSFATRPGDEFLVADLASIESAVIAWLSGCKRLLQVFADGRDPYKDFATELFGVPYDDVTRLQRKISKPAVLGCGYRLGGGELIDGKRTGLWAYAEGMGVDLSRSDAHRSVKVFRQTYPEIPVFWKSLEYAVERTLRTGKPTQVGHLTFESRKPFLMMRLPSGRYVYYYEPRLMPRVISTGRTIVKWIDGVEVEEAETYEKLSLTYMGQNQKTRQWQRIDSHGGRTTEQGTQGMAREVLAYGVVRAHRAGYRLVSHVHDELVATRRVGDNRYTLAGLIENLKTPLPFAPGLPLGAAGWSGPLYRKD